MDRAHGFGRDKPVFVHRPIAANTGEAAIQGMKRRKQALADALFEGTRGSARAHRRRPACAVRYALTASSPVIASLEQTTELPLLDALCNEAMRPGHIVRR